MGFFNRYKELVKKNGTRWNNTSAASLTCIAAMPGLPA